MIKLGKTVKIGLGIVIGAGLVVATVFGAIWVSNIDNRRAEASFPKCEGRHTTHTVDIRNDTMEPSHISAKRCDEMVITNHDKQPRIIAFGKHNEHVAYDGVRERYLSPDGTFSVTLIQSGNFLFHDHNDEKVRATFTVR